LKLLLPFISLGEAYMLRLFITLTGRGKMNSILKFLNNHVSVRQFTDAEISQEDELKIISTAQRSPTSSNLQTYSIVGIRDQEAKEKLASLSGNQKHIIDSSLFLVFCADLNRLKLINQEKGYDYYSDSIEMLLISTIDAALVADRALMAAQAMGMGGVMVGALRYNPDEVSDLLKLPELVYPVMGLSLGYPAVPPVLKPRLAIDAIYYKEFYTNESIGKFIDEYDKKFAETPFLKGREVQPEKYPDFKGLYSWSEHSARKMADKDAARLHFKEYLNKRGFAVR
jgi:FMN reductase (NADPH)